MVGVADKDGGDFLTGHLRILQYEGEPATLHIADGIVSWK